MRDPNQQTSDVTPRRSFFGRIAAMSALGLFGLATTRAHADQSDGADWPGTLKGRHRQVFDIYDINDGFPLGFTNNFLTPNESATAVLIFRHKGLIYLTVHQRTIFLAYTKAPKKLLATSRPLHRHNVGLWPRLCEKS
jgi:hypothetical protein